MLAIGAAYPPAGGKAGPQGPMSGPRCIAAVPRPIPWATASTSMFQNLNAFLRTVVLAALVVLAGWWTLFLRTRLGEGKRELAQREERIAELAGLVQERDGAIGALTEEVQTKGQRITELSQSLEASEARALELETALGLLKVDHRLAHIEVLDQAVEPGAAPGEPEHVRTRVRFTELDPDGRPLGEGRELVIEGKRVYVETLVIKFDDRFVEQGDSLRGTSVCLFKRLFGEDQRPNEGVALDAEGVQPLVYTGDEPNPLHGLLWRRFWDYANDPELARSQGVRAIHGEAPFIEMRPGKTYRVELRASGGLTIQAE